MLGQFEDVGIAVGRRSGLRTSSGEGGACRGCGKRATQKVAPAAARLREHFADALAVEKVFRCLAKAAGSHGLSSIRICRLSNIYARMLLCVGVYAGFNHPEQ